MPSKSSPDMRTLQRGEGIWERRDSAVIFACGTESHILTSYVLSVTEYKATYKITSFAITSRCSLRSTREGNWNLG